MGGHAVGEKASSKAAQSIPLVYAKYAQEGPLAALRRAFLETNSDIHSIGQSIPEFRGMGTTATALLFRKEGAWVAHVGDSRAYRIREGKIEQLTFDHSYAWEMAKRLGVPPEDLPDIKKNVIVRSLGPDNNVQVDIEGPYPLQAGDIYVLCSDGLSNQVAPEEVGTVVSALPTPEAAKLLVELANLRGGPDNITVLLVKVLGTEATTKAYPLVKGPKLGVWLHRGWAVWSRHAPWPITVLLAGFLLAVGSLIARVIEVPGSNFLFVFALLTIVAGVIGLVIYTRQESRKRSHPPEPPRRLNIYREYPCRIERGLVDRLSKLQTHLKEQLEGGNLNIDWTTYQHFNVSASRSLAEGDLLASFRDQCRALLGLAQPYNKHRHKEEGFRPKFE